MDALCSDLPFGHTVGSHTSNRELYPSVLTEAARVSRAGAVCCLLTHQARLLEDIVSARRDWTTERRTRVHLGGPIPTLFVLRRSRG